MLKGSVEQISGQVVTLDVQGVGYEVICSGRCLEKLEPGNRAQIIVHTDVKQDCIKLYGFADHLEKQVFVLLIQVQGVGSRTAAEILSHVDKLDLLRAIGAGDAERLQTVRGIGKKTSQRIVLELKDKVAQFAMEQQSAGFAAHRDALGPVEEAVEALQALGFSRKDAEKAVQTAQARGAGALEPGQLVKEALRYV